MRPSSATLAGLLFLAALAGGCQQQPEPSTRNLVLSGSRSMVPLMEAVGKRFEEQHSGVRVSVQPGAGRAISDTRSGLADIGMLGRPLRPNEVSLNGFPVARDGVAFIVHRDNPIEKLTSSQIVALFTGMSTKWKEVGGPNRPVVLVRPSEGMALREVFLDHFGLQSSQVASTPGAVGSCEQIVQAVAEHPGGIGYVSLGCAETAAARQPIRLLPLGGVPATLAQVQKGRYPFTRPLLLLTREPPAGPVRDFIDFARSNAVGDLVLKHGFVPVSPGQDSDR
jgi:phosphate transport system substrate-binding protein